jgi:hypothetical protein
MAAFYLGQVGRPVSRRPRDFETTAHPVTRTATTLNARSVSYNHPQGCSLNSAERP